MEYDKYLRAVAIILILIMVLLKAQFLFSTEGFEDSASYKYLSEIEDFGQKNIDSGDIIYHDIDDYGELWLLYATYGGIYLVFPGIITIKILELIQMLIFLVLIYYLTKEISNCRFSAIFSIIILLSTPLYFSNPQASINPNIFIVNLFLITTYLLLKSSILFESNIDSKYLKKLFKKLGLGKAKKHFKNNYTIIIGIMFVILAMFPAHSLIFETTLLIYLLELTIFNISSKKYFSELAAFSLLLISGTFIIFHKSLLLKLGVKIFSLNFPSQLIAGRILDFKLINAFIYVGAITLLGGIYSTYYYMNNIKLKEAKKILFFSSGLLVTGITFLLKLGDPNLLLLLMGVCVTILFSGYVTRWVKNAVKNYFLKINETGYWIIICMVIILGSLSLNYSFASTIPYEEVNSMQINAYKDLMNKSENGLIITPYDQADVAKYYSKMSILINGDFLKSDNPTRALVDVKDIYTNINSIKTQEILNEYKTQGVSDIFIYFDENIARDLKIKKPGFNYDKECFNGTSFEGNITIYEYRC